MTLEIAFLDVGNADSIVILPPSASAVIIDVPKPRRIYEWLEDRGTTAIDCIYFTHNHRDHLPSLSNLKTFIAEWLKKGKRQLLYLPSYAIQNIDQLVSTSSDINEVARLKDAIAQFLNWEEEGLLEIRRAERGSSTPERFGEIVVHILHPGYLDSELHPNKVNETSLVLRVEYSEFSTLLLADIEKVGLTKLLNLRSDVELKCRVVKIPHHGAWQTNETDTKTLLDRTNPELAVLSVGSRNQHGHVMPQLFQELLRLKYDKDKRLQDFVCTELTRTCLYSAVERTAMGKSGLSASQPCAGDIVILAEPSGEWEILHREEHIQHLESIPHAACCGRADLSV